MKTKRADELVTKIIVLAIAVVLVGALIYWVMDVYKDKKRDADAANEKINTANQAMADFDLLVYDNKSISGATLKELIEEMNDNEVPVAIQVVTLANATGVEYNYSASNGLMVTLAPTPFPTNKISNDYITPSANFVGEIIRNNNDEIVCIQFTQQP